MPHRLVAGADREDLKVAVGGMLNHGWRARVAGAGLAERLPEVPLVAGTDLPCVQVVSVASGGPRSLVIEERRVAR